MARGPSNSGLRSQTSSVGNGQAGSRSAGATVPSSPLSSHSSTARSSKGSLAPTSSGPSSTALVVRAGPGAAEVVLTETLATELLPDLDAVVSVRRPASLELLARALEAERMTRGRWLHDAEADDAETFRAQNPEHPFPILFALVGDSAKSEWGRLTALAQDAPRFGMAVLFVGAGPDRLPRLRLDASRRVVGRRVSENSMA